MRLTVLELIVWTTLCGLTLGAWRVSVMTGILASFILILTILSRLETVTPQYMIVGFALVILLSVFLIAAVIG